MSGRHGLGFRPVNQARVTKALDVMFAQVLGERVREVEMRGLSQLEAEHPPSGLAATFPPRLRREKAWSRSSSVAGLCEAGA